MKIGFDARMIDHPGIGKYIRNILSEMIDESIDDEFILYGNRYKLADFKKTKSAIREYEAPIYSFEELFLDPFSKEKFDIMHIPHFNVPSHKPDNLVVTIHDLIYLKLTDSSPLYKRVAARPVISNAINKADRIIAVSENTKKDIIENFPGTEDKISVIHEGADPVFKKVEDDERKQIVRLRYDLPTDMILCVGSLKKHKNIERLVDAYIDLKQRGIKHRLVIVGRYRPRESEILQKISTTDAVYLGEVPLDDLVMLYNMADLYVIPSLYEGFGLPVLEAMACGTPVAASRVASLPEVAGDAGVLFNPHDVKEMADSIYKVLSDKDFRQELIRKGFDRTKEFSWEKAAVKTLELYREVAGGR